MAFVGVAPFDPSTPIGQVRSLVGDTQYVDNTDGTGNYGYFADNDLAVLLLQSAQSVLMAAGFAFLKLSALFAATEANVATDDLKIIDTSKSMRFEAIGNDFINRANNVEWFELTPTGDAIVDVRDFFYPTGSMLPSEILYGTTESDLYLGRI